MAGKFGHQRRQSNFSNFRNEMKNINYTKLKSAQSSEEVGSKT